MNKMLRRIQAKRKRLKQEEADEGARRRQLIINDAGTMLRLSQSPDFQRFVELLKEDREGLNKSLLNPNMSLDTKIQDRMRERLIARIDQIDRTLTKPRSLIWRMENLTEVRDAIKGSKTQREASSR